jgi:integrase
MLTDVLIKKLPLPDKRREVPDGRITGLYLVLQPSGARSWALRFRANGAPKKLTIGPYPTIDLATARKRAQEAIGDVAGGKDPAAVKQASKAMSRAERVAEIDRVERVVELFIDRHAKPKTRDWRETQRILVNEIVGRWKGRRLSEITRAHVHEMLDTIIDRGAPIRANRVFASFRKMCRWAIARGIIDRSPCEGLTAPSQETRRDRVLNDDEIRLAWRAFEVAGWPFGPIGQLLLLTGARRDEVAGMMWNEIDLDARVWSLPKARTKNKRDHQIPLSDDAMRIIEGLPHIGVKKGGLVFTVTGTTPVSGFSRAKATTDEVILELLREEAETRGDDRGSVEAPPHWTYHDLRRTLATGLQRLGIRLEVTEAVLNHASGSRAGIVGVYQRHDYADEKRAALDAWARRIEAIVEGRDGDSNVTPLRRGASVVPQVAG